MDEHLFWICLDNMYLLGVMFPKFFVILRETLQKFWGRKFHHFRGDVTCPKSLRKWDFVKHKKFCLSPCGWTMRWVPDSSIIYYTVVYFSEKNIKKIFTSQDDVRSKLVPRCLKMQDHFVVEVVPSHAIQVLHIFIEDLQARSPFWVIFFWFRIFYDCMASCDIEVGGLLLTCSVFSWILVACFV